MSNAGNPITTWIKNGMEPYANRESYMTDRVAETSIAAQKICDERHGPFRSYNNVSNSRKSKDFGHLYLAQSAFKGKDEGCVNSFKSMRYYQEQSKSYRDELLKEVSEA
ncbi:hypothetical protein CTEN210_18302 [Chaetoceros tenuissimus]|uniref:Uncharacterized protein n=1 Tax=Chaetoceros tenuissimus TaxID=426638 RepID=A0AAD3DCK7_9STRA|nr:hypothetical protein CTEN210_18302 [Chaetoceros tenuissimus]